MESRGAKLRRDLIGLCSYTHSHLAAHRASASQQPFSECCRICQPYAKCRRPQSAYNLSRGGMEIGLTVSVGAEEEQLRVRASDLVGIRRYHSGCEQISRHGRRCDHEPGGR
jgi:hypothetical protein